MRARRKHPYNLIVLALCLSGVAALPGGADVKPGDLAPLSDFQAYNQDELLGLQVKLTYVGVQRKTTPTLAFTSYQHVLDMSRFASFRREGVHYGNDDAAVWNFTATTAELSAVIQGAAKIAAVAQPRDVGDPWVSLMLYNEVGGEEKGFEALLGRADAEKLASAVADAIARQNGLARQIVADWVEQVFP
ncbi:MAG: hypothetical protein ACE5R4_09515 [Armatimonadota bacterium]